MVEPPVPPPRRGATILERSAGCLPRAGKDTQREPAPDEANANTSRLHPLKRPPTPLLCVLDDGSPDDGEWRRIRHSSFVIGRVEGDVVIPHDNEMSAQHVSIVRREEQGRYRFYLRDMTSTNGTFVRVATGLLRHEQELLIGSRRYQFRLPERASGGIESDDQPATRGWRTVKPEDALALIPTLIDLSADDEEMEYQLDGDEHILGSDAKGCTVVIRDDPFVSPRHVKISRDKRDRWVVENLKSMNGVWLRVANFPLDTNAEFLAGEQRFLLRFP